MTFFSHPFDFNCRCETCIFTDRQIRENIKKEKRPDVHMSNLEAAKLESLEAGE
jgi:hypothetical protein